MRKSEDEPSQLAKLGSAFFYAACSICIFFVNKSVLTIHHFPSANFVGLGQMCAAVLVLGFLRQCGVVSFPRLSSDMPRRIFPLPLFYVANMITGLNSTKSLSLPMFTVLRRFSILMTMILEFYILGTRPKRLIVLAVFVMIFGAIVAAANDLAYDGTAYCFILANDLFTAANGVYTKSHLNRSEIGKYGIIFYNALFSLPFVAIAVYINGDIDRALYYSGWNNPEFVIQFGLSCVMGFVLMYSVVLCTQYNSSLTTTVVGCLKNLVVTYIGMLVGGDYVFSLMNFLGINISVAGSIVYSYIAFKFTTKKPQAPVIKASVKTKSL